ncbi:hypothetical protein REPUB_Repub13aG0236200 [Reevesia pubescens]
MCSNNTSKNVGVRVVANANGVSDHDDYESSSLRKSKKQRIPKRGPGVAELEKILREQEKKDGYVEKGKINIGGISSSVVPLLPHSSFASSSNSLPRNVTFLCNTPSTPPLPPPVTTHHVNGNADIFKGSNYSLLGCGNVGGNGRTKGVYIGGSGVFLPEQTLLPITWDSSETRKAEETPKMATDFSFPILVSNGSDHNNMFPPPMLQKNCGPCHPSMMNLFPQSAISSSSTPSSAAGMIGAKRPRPNFPVDNWPPPPPHMPCQPPFFQPQASRLDPSSSSSNHGVFNLGTASRNPMPSSPLELKVKTCVNNDNGNPSGNGSATLITLGSPTTPLPSTQNCQPDFSKFIKRFPFQETKENSGGYSLQRSSSESDVSVHKSSFFSFLLKPEDQPKRDAAEAALGLKNEKYCTEKTADFIDLNLKL